MNRSLRSLRLGHFEHRDTQRVVSEALQTNPTLLELGEDVWSPGEYIPTFVAGLGLEGCAALARNRRNLELRELWVSVTRVVRHGAAPGFPAVCDAMTPRGLRAPCCLADCG